MSRVDPRAGGPIVEIQTSNCHAQSYGLLPEDVRERLRKVARVDDDSAAAIYESMAQLYRDTTESFAFESAKELFEAERDKAVEGYLRTLSSLTEQYYALSDTQRRLAQETLTNRTLESLEPHQGMAPVRAAELPGLMHRLRALDLRLALRPKTRRGRRRYPDLDNSAAEACDQWEACTDRAATWNERVSGGLFEFNAICSDAFKMEVTLVVKGRDGGQVSLPPASFSLLRSAASAALRSEVRYRVRERKTSRKVD